MPFSRRLQDPGIKINKHASCTYHLARISREGCQACCFSFTPTLPICTLSVFGPRIPNRTHGFEGWYRVLFGVIVFSEVRRSGPRVVVLRSAQETVQQDAVRLSNALSLQNKSFGTRGELRYNIPSVWPKSSCKDFRRQGQRFKD